MEPDLSESQICVNLVKDFINKYLDINASHMIFDRVQRLGNSKKAKLPRPIIAKFHYFKEREIVRNASNKKKKETAQGNQTQSFSTDSEGMGRSTT